MKKTILYMIILLITISSVSASMNRYYTIDLSYDQGNITVSKISVDPSQKIKTNAPGTYLAEVVSNNNEILNITYFSLGLTLITDEINPETGIIESGGTIELEQKEISIYVPYFENAHEINIYAPGLEQKASIDVGGFSKEKAPPTTKPTEPPKVKHDLGSGIYTPVYQTFGFYVLLGIIVFISWWFYIRKRKQKR